MTIRYFLAQEEHNPSLINLVKRGAWVSTKQYLYMLGNMPEEKTKPMGLDTNPPMGAEVCIITDRYTGNGSNERRHVEAIWANSGGVIRLDTARIKYGEAGGTTVAYWIGDGVITKRRPARDYLQIRESLRVKEEQENLRIAKVQEYRLRSPMVAGRQRITGRVVSIKSVVTDFGTVEKMLVELEDGYRMYGSLPSTLAGVRPDAIIEFDAEVITQLPDFGFFKRPTKATIVENIKEKV